MKRVLFIDRDGTLIVEPKDDFQVDSLEKLEFIPGVFRWLSRIQEELDYHLVMVTNQDGLGTDSFPEDTFWPAHNKMLKLLEAEGIIFDDVLIDRSFEHEGLDTRKPGLGMMQSYISGDYDLANSYVLGDRESDMQLAKNLGAQGIFIGDEAKSDVALIADHWKAIYEFLRLENRSIRYERNTNETQISIFLDLDGKGPSSVKTGLNFFDHMLDQIARHGGIQMQLSTQGDLHVDEHHTIEDTGIALGEAFAKALGDKLGIERYGYTLPMDDCLAQVALDFGGRNWLKWKAGFQREMVGDMPTEMFFHFFKSFSDGAKCNLNIKAEGLNEHHKIEAIFKAFAKAIKMAIRRDPNHMILPSTKGAL